MKRKFLIQLLFLIFINLLVKPFYAFGIDLQVQNRVTQEDYGLYFVLFNFSFLLQIFSDWGLQQYNNRQVAQYPEGWLPRYFSQFLMLKLLLSAIMLGGGAIVAWLLGYWELAGWGGGAMLLNQVLLTFILFIRSNVSGLQFYFLDSILSVLDKLILIFICLIGLYTSYLGEFTIFSFIFAQTVSLALTALVALVILMRCHRQPIVWRFTVNWQLLRRTTPYAMVVLLMTFYARIDAILIERLLPDGVAQAGLYAFGYRILDMISVFCFLFANLLLPMFARLLRQQHELKSLLELSFRLMVLLTVAASSLLLVYADPLCQWLYDKYTPQATSVLQMLLFSFNAIGFIYIFGTLLTAAGRLWAMNIVFLLAIGCSLLLNLLLIPSFGALGAAYTAIATQSLVAIAELYLVRRWLGSLFTLRTWLQMLLFVSGTAVIAYFSPLITVFDWRLTLCLAALCIAVWALLSRWISLSSIKKM